MSILTVKTVEEMDLHITRQIPLQLLWNRTAIEQFGNKETEGRKGRKMIWIAYYRINS